MLTHSPKSTGSALVIGKIALIMLVDIAKINQFPILPGSDQARVPQTTGNSNSSTKRRCNLHCCDFDFRFRGNPERGLKKSLHTSRGIFVGFPQVLRFSVP